MKEKVKMIAMNNKEEEKCFIKIKWMEDQLINNQKKVYNKTANNYNNKV